MGQLTRKELKTITLPHDRVHAGRFYSTQYLALSVSNDAYIDILLKTDRHGVHTVFEAAAGGDAIAELYEETEVSSDGTQIGIVNHNRKLAASHPTLIEAYHSPTVTNVGVKLSEKMTPGGTGGSAIGATGHSEGRAGTEWILKPDVNYLLRLTNKAGNAQFLQLALSFYEYD